MEILQSFNLLSLYLKVCICHFLLLVTHAIWKFHHKWNHVCNLILLNGISQWVDRKLYSITLMQRHLELEFLVHLEYISKAWLHSLFCIWKDLSIRFLDRSKVQVKFSWVENDWYLSMLGIALLMVLLLDPSVFLRLCIRDD